MTSLINPDENPELTVPLMMVKQNGGQVNGKTKFQKLVFLAQTENELDNYFEFQRYNHGPYSFDLTDNIETLVGLGLLEEKVTKFRDRGFQGERHEYELTEKAKNLLERFDNSNPIIEIEKSCKSTINEWGDNNLQSILDYVYDKYM